MPAWSNGRFGRKNKLAVDLITTKEPKNLNNHVDLIDWSDVG
jgi:hypothetical protein